MPSTFDPPWRGSCRRGSCGNRRTASDCERRVPRCGVQPLDVLAGRRGHARQRRRGQQALARGSAKKIRQRACPSAGSSRAPSTKRLALLTSPFFAAVGGSAPRAARGRRGAEILGSAASLARLLREIGLVAAEELVAAVAGQRHRDVLARQLRDEIGRKDREVADRIVHEVHQMIEQLASLRPNDLDPVIDAEMLRDPRRPRGLVVGRIVEANAEGLRPPHRGNDERAVDTAGEERADGDVAHHLIAHARAIVASSSSSHSASVFSLDAVAARIGSQYSRMATAPDCKSSSSVLAGFNRRTARNSVASPARTPTRGTGQEHRSRAASRRAPRRAPP